MKINSNQYLRSAYITDKNSICRSESQDEAALINAETIYEHGNKMNQGNAGNAKRAAIYKEAAVYEIAADKEAEAQHGSAVQDDENVKANDEYGVREESNDIQHKKNKAGYIFMQDSTSSLTRTSNDNKKNNSDYSAVNDLIELARAEKASQVRAIKGRLLSKVIQLSKSGLELEVLTKLIVKIRKIIRKADKKLNKLCNEENLEAKRVKAEKNRRHDEAERLQEEIKRRKRKRKREEENDIIEEKRKEALKEDTASGTVTHSSAYMGNVSLTQVESGSKAASQPVYGESTFEPAVSDAYGAGIDVLL